MVGEGDGGQTIAFVYPNDATDTVMFSGRLVEDGSNSLGPIWRVEDVRDEDVPQGVESVRVQLPEGVAEGDPTGRWYVELTSQDGVGYVVAQIDEDGTARSLNSLASTGTTRTTIRAITALTRRSPCGTFPTATL